jgi:hypothetical protein
MDLQMKIGASVLFALGVFLAVVFRRIDHKIAGIAAGLAFVSGLFLF